MLETNVKREYLKEITEILSSERSLKEKRELLLQYHESDIAEVLDELNEEERKEFYSILDVRPLRCRITDYQYICRFRKSGCVMSINKLIRGSVISYSIMSNPTPLILSLKAAMLMTNSCMISRIIHNPNAIAAIIHC